MDISVCSIAKMASTVCIHACEDISSVLTIEIGKRKGFKRMSQLYSGGYSSCLQKILGSTTLGR